jgi:aminomethyltransferase
MPYGVTAMQTLRLEKAYPLYGNDITEDYTPFHIGLDRWIRFEKRDFIGRDALLRTRERGLDERWVGLVIHGDTPAPVNAKVFSIGAVTTTEERMFSGPEAGAAKERELPGGEEVGHVTYSNKGHTVGKMLALAYVRTSHSWPGSRLLIEINDRPVPAIVTSTPFFDPQGARLRAKA